MKLLTSTCLLLSLLVIVAVFSATTSTFFVRAISDADAQNLTNTLKSFEDFLNISIDNAVTQLAGTSTTCSINNIACDPYVSVPKINFSQVIPAQYGHVQPKEWTGQDYTQMMEQTCELIRMGPKWLQNYNNSNKKILYQYFSYPDNYAGFYPMSPWNCSETYTPTERPYFSAGATGARDVVILMDASTRASDSAWRLATSKKVAEKIVRSLSFKDFVAIIPYGDQPQLKTSVLNQATQGNIATIVATVNNVTSMPGNGTNIGAALDYAFQVFGNSKSIGLTSKCTRVIVLLSGGDNNLAVPRVGTPIANNPDALVFPLLVSTNVTHDKTVLMKNIACASGTITRTITGDDAKNITQWRAVTDYFSKLLSTSIMRWSEVYSEDDGQGQVLSLSAPVFTDNALGDRVFAGVTTLDISVAGVDKNGTITTDEINDYIQSNEVCSPLNHRLEYQAANVEEIQNGTCSQSDVNPESIGFKTSTAGEQLAINKGMPGIIVGSVFFIVILFGVGIYVNSLNNDRSYSYDCAPPFIALVIFLVCWIISIPIMFTLIAPDLVRVNNFVETELTLSTTKDYPYRCCEITSCSYCSYTSSASCSSEIPRLIAYVGGPVGSSVATCGNGYYCCETYCYSCNCRRSCSGSGTKRKCRTTCSTCCRCTSSTSNRQCTIGCGSCYRMVTQFYYTYNGERLQSQWTTTCSLAGSTACRDNWYARYPSPSLRMGWVDPENPISVLEDVEVRRPPFIAFMVFACFSIPFLIFAYYKIFSEFCGSGEESPSATSAWEMKNAAKKDEPVIPVGTDSDDGDMGHTVNPVAVMPQANYSNNVGVGDNVAPPSGGYNFMPMPANADNDNNNNNIAPAYPYPVASQIPPPHPMAFGVLPPPPENDGTIQGI